MKRWWGFVPYLIVGVVHVGALVTGDEPLATPTKVLLMPALVLALFLSLPQRRSAIAAWATLALLFSWGGDALLSSPGGLGFMIGLGLFALAHGTYLVLFLGPLKERRMPRLALSYALWWIALVVVLLPHLGGLLVPVAVYGLVLGAAAAAAAGSNRVVAIGGLLFLLSDTLLAFKLFYPGFALWQQDAIIMVGYIAGQGLIIAGAVLHARRSAAAGHGAVKAPGKVDTSATL